MSGADSLDDTESSSTSCSDKKQYLRDSIPPTAGVKNGFNKEGVLTTALLLGSSDSSSRQNNTSNVFILDTRDPDRHLRFL